MILSSGIALRRIARCSGCSSFDESDERCGVLSYTENRCFVFLSKVPSARDTPLRLRPGSNSGTAGNMPAYIPNFYRKAHHFRCCGNFLIAAAVYPSHLVNAVVGYTQLPQSSGSASVLENCNACKSASSTAEHRN